MTAWEQCEREVRGPGSDWTSIRSRGSRRHGFWSMFWPGV